MVLLDDFFGPKTFFKVVIAVFIALFITGWFTLSYKQNSKILNMVKNYHKAKTLKGNFEANTHVIYQKLLYVKNMKQLI